MLIHKKKYIFKSNITQQYMEFIFKNLLNCKCVSFISNISYKTYETIGNLSCLTPFTNSISTPLGSSENCSLNWLATSLWNCISGVAFRMVFWCRTKTTINAIVDTTAKPTPKVIASLNALLTKTLSNSNWNCNIHTLNWKSLNKKSQQKLTADVIV